MSIHIKPSHKGLLHKDLGIPQGEPIPESRIKAAENSPDPAVRKRAHFAENARHFNHSRPASVVPRHHSSSAYRRK